jgi:hypothetical protein
MYNTLDSCTWDANGNCLAMMDLMWDGMAWTNNMLESWTYDANGKMLSDIAQFWDGMSWSYMFQLIFTNNANGYRTSSLEQYYDGMGWINSYKDTMMYDAANNYISYTNWNSWDGMTWELYSKGDFTYDSNGNMLTRINQMWNTVTWKNYVKIEYSYQSGLIIADAYTWASTVWTADDSYFNVTYNDNGNKIVFYAGAEAAVEVAVNYSIVISGINDPETNGSILVAVYPNPVTNFLTILPANSSVIIKKVQIFDFSGKELVADYSGNRLNLGNLQNGMYMLKLTMHNGFTEVKKIVKQ